MPDLVGSSGFGEEEFVENSPQYALFVYSVELVEGSQNRDRNTPSKYGFDPDEFM